MKELVQIKCVHVQLERLQTHEWKLCCPFLLQESASLLLFGFCSPLFANNHPSFLHLFTPSIRYVSTEPLGTVGFP